MSVTGPPAATPVTVKGADELPWRMVTLAGEIVASAVLLLPRVMVTPPGPAGDGSVTVPPIERPIPIRESVVEIDNAPPVMLNVLLVAEVRPVLVAESVYPVPTLLMLRPLKVATPFAAATVSVPLNVPADGFVPMARVTEFDALVTVLPAASWMVTFGDGVMVDPACVLDGCTEKASLAAAPGVMLKALLVAEVNPALDAVSV